MPLASAVVLGSPNGHPVLGSFTLAMPATDLAALVADGQLPAALLAPPAQHSAAIFGLHTIEKTMLTTTGNALWLPGSLRHCIPLACANVPRRYMLVAERPKISRTDAFAG